MATSNCCLRRSDALAVERAPLARFPALTGRAKLRRVCALGPGDRLAVRLAGGADMGWRPGYRAPFVSAKLCLCRIHSLQLRWHSPLAPAGARHLFERKHRRACDVADDGWVRSVSKRLLATVRRCAPDAMMKISCGG